MAVRVLFVDDDVSLLKSIQRNLCFDYDLSIAESGQQALELIRQNEPFSVVVTDMRMPVMDGIHFINEARQIAPDSMYLMLTGNQDVDTAIKAVNHGQVYRFLSKPCETADIKTAVNAAHRQFELVHAEKELLHKTFVGAVSLMTDVVETLHPDTMQQSQRVDTIMRICEEALGCTGNWEFRLAARLSLIGHALLPCDEQLKFQQLGPNERESQLLLNKIAVTSSRLIGRVPRLEGVGEILRKQSLVDGSVFHEPYEGHNTDLGAVLLKVAVHWSNMINHGLCLDDAIGEIQQAVPGLPQQIQSALQELDAPASNRAPIELAVSDLTEGMVLYDNVVSEDGALLLRSGRRLTPSVIEKMKLHFQTSARLRPIIVVASSCPQEVQTELV
jgi:response regulator RpfG family c-di-GMP phosphodiesterase